mgnify:CR=1 FL=1
MRTDDHKITDSLVWLSGYNRAKADHARIFGWGWAELRDERGHLKLEVPFTNLVTEVGDQFYGDRAAGILSTSRTLTALTNATNSVATTSAAHGFGIGDVVTIAGVTPAGYNGDWAINAIGSTTTFTIYVGTALGAGSAFGTAQTKASLPKHSGMRLGTGTTAVAKTGAGAAIVTYTAATTSSKALDSGFPTSALSGSSRRIQYKTTWNAGEATITGLAEVVITIEQPLTDVAGTAANTISRALLSPTVNKGASDTLAVTWNHDLLGA